MIVMTTIETPRLLLRPLREEDMDAYAAMHADPEIMRYLGEGVPLSREESWRNMAMFLGHWTLRGYGMWALEERATGAFVGRAGLHCPEGWPDREVGWALARAHWGKGYALEAAQAALQHAFATLQWPRAISLIDPENQRSIRVAERLGERLDREITLRGKRTLLYSVERQAWTGGGAPAPADV